jgi:hypothetical protein
MKITKASIMCFLLVPLFIWQANQILESCAAEQKETRFTISEADPCNGDYRLFFINVYIFTAFVCLFTAVFLVWRSRRLQEFSLLKSENKGKTILSVQQGAVEDKSEL